MATTTQDKDEDLIILDSDSNSDLFDFGETTVSQETKKEDVSMGEDLVIDFGEIKESKEIDEDIKEETTMNTASDDLNEIDFSFGFGSDENNDINENTSDFSSSSENVGDLFGENEKQDTSFFEEITSSSFEESNFGEPTTIVSNDDLDMETILNQTIDKLNNRKNLIEVQKNEKESKVEELKSKIKELENEVENFNSQISELEEESQKIEKNIMGIENMKNPEAENSQERQRKHNLKNIKNSK